MESDILKDFGFDDELDEETKDILKDAIQEDELVLPKDVGDDMADEGILNK